MIIFDFTLIFIPYSTQCCTSIGQSQTWRRWRLHRTKDIRLLSREWSFFCFDFHIHWIVLCWWVSSSSFPIVITIIVIIIIITIIIVIIIITIITINLSFLAVILLMLFLAKRRQTQLAEKRKISRRRTQRNSKPAENEFVGKISFMFFRLKT